MVLNPTGNQIHINIETDGKVEKRWNTILPTELNFKFRNLDWSDTRNFSITDLLIKQMDRVLAEMLVPMETWQLSWTARIFERNRLVEFTFTIVYPECYNLYEGNWIATHSLPYINGGSYDPPFIGGNIHSFIGGNYASHKRNSNEEQAHWRCF